MAAARTPQTRARRAAASRGVRALHVGMLFVTLMAMCGGAWSVWSSTGAGTGSATTGTLGAPTAVSAVSTPGTTSVSVSWSVPATGVVPVGYRIVRTNTATGVATASCDSSASSPVTTTSCTDRSVPDGTYRYTVVALRSGWTSTSAESSPVTVIGPVATTTSVSSSGSPSVVGQSVTFTATVSATSGTATGTVVFRDGGTAISCAGGSQTLSSGTATCVVTPATAGTLSITVGYAGSAPYSASTSSAISQVVDPAATKTVLASSVNPSVVGQSVTYTATVTAMTPGGGTPAGTVTFKDGGANLPCEGGNQTLTSGTATCVVSHLSASTRGITAVYAGSANHRTSSSPTVSQVVGAASTTTSLATSSPSVRTGQAVTYTAMVAAVAPGAGVPTGSVTFTDGTTTILCSSGSQALNGSGVATCTTSFATMGTHSVTATYAGSVSHTTSTSTAVSQGVVNALATGLTFTGVKVNGAVTVPVCTGSVGTTWSCTVSGGNNAVVVANVGFATLAGVPVSYSGNTESIGWVSTGKAAGSGTVAVAPNATTSTSTVTATKNGSNPVTVTVTFTASGGSSWTAVLTLT